MLKIEENELLAALLTAQEVGRGYGVHSPCFHPEHWREQYAKRLREFIELNKAEEPK